MAGGDFDCDGGLGGLGKAWEGWKEQWPRRPEQPNWRLIWAHLRIAIAPDCDRAERSRLVSRDPRRELSLEPQSMPAWGAMDGSLCGREVLWPRRLDPPLARAASRYPFHCDYSVLPIVAGYRALVYHLRRSLRRRKRLPWQCEPLHQRPALLATANTGDSGSGVDGSFDSATSDRRAEVRMGLW